MYMYICSNPLEDGVFTPRRTWVSRYDHHHGESGTMWDLLMSQGCSTSLPFGVAGTQLGCQVFSVT